MARSRSIGYYPAEFLTATEDIMLKGQKILITMADKASAEKLRGQFYAFVGAGHRAQQDIETRKLNQEQEKKKFGHAITELTEEQKRNAHLGHLAAKILITVKEEANGTVLMTWQKRDESWQAVALMNGMRVGSAREEAAAKEVEAEALRRETQRQLEKELQEVDRKLREEAALTGAEPPAESGIPSHESLTAKYGFRGRRR